MDSNVVLGLLGAFGGIIGGGIGTYFGICRMATLQERSFMMKAAIWTWLGVSGFLAILFLLPASHRWIAWVAYSMALPFFIRYINRQQRLRRDSESGA